MLDQTLPTWDLTDLYASPEDEQITADLASLQQRAKAFAAAYEGKITDLTSAELAIALQEYEAMAEGAGKISTYAFLHFASQVTDPTRGQFRQNMTEQLTVLTLLTQFFTLEMQALDERELSAKLTNPSAAKYAPWVDTFVRPFAQYRLSKEMEAYIAEASTASDAGFVRLFDETMAALSVEVRGQTLSQEQALKNLQSPERALREESGRAMAAALKDRAPTLTLITNTLAKSKEIQDRTRGYPSPMAAKNLSNAVEDEVVHALVEAVRGTYPTLAHRYYTMKAKWLGLNKLAYWDRNAPLPDEDTAEIPYAQGVAIVRAAYKAFSPELEAVAAPFFENAWIDVPARPGKAPGAFAHPCVPSVHPYLLLNYQGKTRDVMTLAHELGHGVHQRLAARQGLLKADTPLTLAETASVFGEMLTFRALLNQAESPAQKKHMLASKVEDMLNTVIRQISFHEFEWAVHTRRKDGELSTEQLNQLWLVIAKRSLGPAFDFDEEYGAFWSYVPHFIHSPFYVYAYAFGDCLVNALYAEYEAKPEGFEEKYLDLLRAGGSKRHAELLKPFGLDARKPDFWSKGLSFIGSLIDELEILD